MVTGTTTTGFSYEIDPAVVSDMEFLEMVADASDNPLLLGRLLAALLGADQKKALYDHVRGTNGRVDVNDIEKEVTEIFEQINTNGATKN